MQCAFCLSQHASSFVWSKFSGKIWELGDEIIAGSMNTHIYHRISDLINVCVIIS